MRLIYNLASLIFLAAALLLNSLEPHFHPTTESLFCLGLAIFSKCWAIGHRLNAD